MGRKRTEFDCIAGSELKDTQGETLDIAGADISELKRANDNHGKGFFNSIGTIIESKKIFKEEDCDNERQKYYWEKIKAPYIYARGFLYDDEDHPNARAAAAILRNIHKNDSPLSLKASVEGGVIARGIKDSTRLARTKIHSVALTFTPANNATLVEPLNLDKSNSNWESDKQLIKSVMHLAETNVPSFRHIERHASANTIYENIHKIQELAKTVGVDIEIKDISSPEEIMRKAVLHKISDNVHKIRDLVKADHSYIKKKPVNVAPSTVKPVAVSQEPEPGTVAAKRLERRDKYQQGVSAMKAGAYHPPGKGVSNLQQEEQSVITPDQHKVNMTIGRHVNKASRDPAHLDNIYNQLKESHGHDKATAVVNKIKEKMQKSIKEQMIKALTAGYGGVGAPGALVGGGVIQSESLEDGRAKKGETTDGISYIGCDNCGHEQAYMPHQVKCRECNKNFSLTKLENFMKSLENTDDQGLV